MRFTWCLLIGLITVATTSADPWKLGIQSNVGLNLNSYSDNWIGGDVGTFAWSAQMLATAERQFNDILNNKNTLNLAFGQTKTQDKSTKHWSKPQKSSDKIEFESVLKFTLNGYVDPFVAVHVASLFMDEYKVVSGADTVMLDKEGNPIDLVESFGVVRDFVKNPAVELTSRLGGAIHENIDRKRVSDSLERTDGGLESVTNFKVMNPSKSITYVSRLSIYEALFRGQPDNNDLWRHPDVNWENTVAVSLAKYIMLSLSWQLLYDRELANGGLQLKETLAAGLTFSAESPKK